MLPTGRIAERTTSVTRRSGRLVTDASRPAFSLIEILLIATLLVVLAGIVLPNVVRLVNGQDVVNASGEFSRFIAETRRETIARGGPCWWRYEVGGHRLIRGEDTGALSEANAEVIFVELSESVSFGEDELTERLPESAADGLSADLRDAPWSPAFRLYPDGSADEFALEIHGETGQSRFITMRGLTGELRVSRVSMEDTAGDKTVGQP